MTNMLLYDRDKAESVKLVKYASHAVALYSNDYLKVSETRHRGEIEAFFEKKEKVDLSMFEISVKKDIPLAEYVREQHQSIDMMLIAENSISPMEYMTPKVRACSLLLRPYSEDQARQVIKDFVGDYYRKYEASDEENSLLIENRDGKVVVPCSAIYYLEVRGKKVYIRLRNKEYCKYDSLENMLKLLPNHFLQSHRSFVFNMNYFERVKLSENIIYLENGISVPLSRSFKADIKRYLEGLRV